MQSNIKMDNKIDMQSNNNIYSMQSNMQSNKMQHKKNK